MFFWYRLVWVDLIEGQLSRLWISVWLECVVCMLVVRVDHGEVRRSGRWVVPRPHQPAAEVTETHGPRGGDQPEQGAAQLAERGREWDDQRQTLRRSRDPGDPSPRQRAVGTARRQGEGQGEETAGGVTAGAVLPGTGRRQRQAGRDGKTDIVQWCGTRPAQRSYSAQQASGKMLQMLIYALCSQGPVLASGPWNRPNPFPGLSAPCGLRGSNVPRSICWFWCCINRLFANLTSLLTFPYLPTSLFIYFFINSPFHFQAGSRKRRPNPALVFCLFYVVRQPKTRTL